MKNKAFFFADFEGFRQNAKVVDILVDSDDGAAAGHSDVACAIRGPARSIRPARRFR